MVVVRPVNRHASILSAVLPLDHLVLLVPNDRDGLAVVARDDVRGERHGVEALPENLSVARRDRPGQHLEELRVWTICEGRVPHRVRRAVSVRDEVRPPRVHVRRRWCAAQRRRSRAQDS